MLPSASQLQSCTRHVQQPLLHCRPRKLQLCRRVAVTEAQQTARVVGWGSSSAQGPRPTMEDELRLETNTQSGVTFAAVFDGHGGETSAQWLQQHFYEDYIQKLDRQVLKQDPQAEPVLDKHGVTRSSKTEQLMYQAFQQADNALLQYLLEEKGRVTGASGATGTVALVQQDRAVFASLGDSLPVLCRNGTPVQLTAQHRVYGFGEGVLEEIERVEAAGGWIIDGRVCNILAVSRAFGDPEFKVTSMEQLQCCLQCCVICNRQHSVIIGNVYCEASPNIGSHLQLVLYGLSIWSARNDKKNMTLKGGDPAARLLL
eukprot:GHRR01013578.1.p1 GENE.GHRR01013578.1~~GHRR01013578.1.p1  ORF type:complete len:315 (+),score=72.80 GHRR01013578.1:603-1547(+)